MFINQYKLSVIIPELVRGWIVRNPIFVHSRPAKSGGYAQITRRTCHQQSPNWTHRAGEHSDGPYEHLSNPRNPAPSSD